MRRHYLQKFLSVTLYYGWFGVLYGSLFAFALQGYGFEGVWIKRVLITVTFMVTVGFAYRMEMRYDELALYMSETLGKKAKKMGFV